MGYDNTEDSSDVAQTAVRQRKKRVRPIVLNRTRCFVCRKPLTYTDDQDPDVVIRNHVRNEHAGVQLPWWNRPYEPKAHPSGPPGHKPLNPKRKRQVEFNKSREAATG